MTEGFFDEEFSEDILGLVGEYEKMENSNQLFMEEGDLEQVFEYYEENEQFEKALALAEKAIVQFPFSATFIVKKAQILSDYKRYDEALDLLDKAAIFDPNDIAIYLLRADIYVFRSQYVKAIKSIRRGLKVCEQDEVADLYLELADVYEEWEKYDKVFKYLKRTLQIAPENEEALNRLWFCVEFTESYADSIEFHKQYIDKYPFSYLAWFNLAHAYSGMKLYEQAIDAFEYVIAINDTYEYAYKDCGDILFKLKQYQKAAEYYQDAIKLSKPYKELYYSLGLCYERMAQHNRARNWFRKATQVDPYFDEAYYRIGLNYEKEKKNENAIGLYERAFKLNNQHADVVNALARISMKLGDLEKAILYYQKLIELKPLNHKAWVSYASALFESGHLKLSLDIMEGAIQRFPEHAALLFVKSALYYRIGNKNGAFVELQKGLMKHPGDFEILYKYAPDMAEDIEVMRLINQYLCRVRKPE